MRNFGSNATDVDISNMINDIDLTVDFSEFLVYMAPVPRENGPATADELEQSLTKKGKDTSALRMCS
jgi:hypothetical protein